MHRAIAPLAATAALAAAVAPATAAGGPAPQPITAKGAGGVQLGLTYTQLRQRKLIGPLRKGCPLVRGQRIALLRSPLKGSVEFDAKRRAIRVLVTKGGAANGVRSGSPSSAIRPAFGAIRVSHRTDRTFGITLVTVPRASGGPLQLSVNTKTKRVATIAVPSQSFCE